MTSSELMTHAITAGLVDDATTSAALDAIREESGCSLLAAVLEVARVHAAARDARDITEATTYLNDSSGLGDALKESVRRECFNLPGDVLATITLIAGDRVPVAIVNAVDSAAGLTPLASIMVGAQWVKREASRIMLERERSPRRPRRRRST